MSGIMRVACLLILAGISFEVQGAQEGGISLAPVIEQIDNEPFVEQEIDDGVSTQSDEITALNSVSLQPQRNPALSSLSFGRINSVVVPSIAAVDLAPDLCTTQSSCSFLQFGNRYTFNSKTRSCSLARTCNTDGFETQEQCEDSCINS